MPMRLLDFDASLPGHHVTKTLVKDGSLELPVSVLLLLPDVAATVEVSLTGTEAGGREVTAHTSFASMPHDQTRLSMTLVGPGDDLAMPQDLNGADFYGEDLAATDLATQNADLAGVDLTVVPTLSVLAGVPGGNGTFDGIGRDARLNVPQQAVLVGSTLYVPEYFTGKLRTVDVTNGMVGTADLVDSVSGNSFALDGPLGMVSDGQGHLYVANSFEKAIRKIDLGNLQVSLVMGGFQNPVGLAYDNGSLWVSDEADCTIRKIDLAGPTLTTVAGSSATCNILDGSGTGAHFTRPRGLALYNDDLYVADESALRKLHPTPSPTPAPVSTVLAPGSFVGTTGLASAGGGVLYVIDQAYNSLYRVTLPNTRDLVAGAPAYTHDFADGLGAAARFADPRWLVLDGAGTTYVVEGSSVRAVTLSNFNVTTLAGMSGQSDSTDSPRARFDQPSSVVFDGVDTLYVAEFANNDIRKVTLSTGNTVTWAGNHVYASADGQGTGASFHSPVSMAFDASGNLYVADFYGNCIRKVTPAADVTTISGLAETQGIPSPSPVPGANARYYDPAGLAFDGDHTLYVADSGNHAIRAIDLSTANFVTAWVAGDGSDGSLAGIGRAAQFSYPNGLAWDNHTLYVADRGTGLVRKIDFTNPALPNVTTLSGTPFAGTSNDGSFASATFGQLGQMTLANNALWVADNSAQIVRKLSFAGSTVSTVVGKSNFPITKPGPLPGFVHGPWGVAMTPRGLVVTSWDENCVLLAGVQ